MLLADLRDIILVKTIGETAAKRHAFAFDFHVLFSFFAFIVWFLRRGRTS